MWIYILFAFLIVNIDFIKIDMLLRNDVKAILVSIYNIIKLKLKLISINFRLWVKNKLEERKEKSWIQV